MSFKKQKRGQSTRRAYREVRITVRPYAPVAASHAISHEQPIPPSLRPSQKTVRLENPSVSKRGNRVRHSMRMSISDETDEAAHYNLLCGHLSTFSPLGPGELQSRH